MRNGYSSWKSFEHPHNAQLNESWKKISFYSLSCLHNYFLKIFKMKCMSKKTLRMLGDWIVECSWWIGSSFDVIYCLNTSKWRNKKSLACNKKHITTSNDNLIIIFFICSFFLWLHRCRHCFIMFQFFSAFVDLWSFAENKVSRRRRREWENLGAFKRLERDFSRLVRLMRHLSLFEVIVSNFEKMVVGIDQSSFWLNEACQ